MFVNISPVEAMMKKYLPEKNQLLPILLLCFLFYLFLQYFTTDDQAVNSFLLNAGFTVVVFLALIFSAIFINYIFKKKLLVLWQHILFTFLRNAFLWWILVSGYWFIVGAYYQNAAAPLISSALIMVAGSIWLVINLVKSYRKERKSWSQEIISFQSENKNEKLVIERKNLLYIKSSFNYCEVYFRNNAIQKEIIRGTLKNLAQQISHPAVIHVHRSYIANLDNISKYKGNSQGLSLYYDGVDQPAIVSRKKVKKVKDYLDQRYHPTYQ